ncbi:MAG: Lrp/AsnC family transcriptional regulator [Thermoanaerobacterales bacterium]|nr:Lrp/AsnC family transcriptional regulator [Bacillota bacterium]MDI6907239.1 Lrp/AsnC family transcriptional regulator [Thermoanaerobacterales bacterium]
MNADRRLEILELLANDARLTARQIAVMLGEPEEEVCAAIAELEANHTILAYRTLINWDKAGRSRVLALIEVRVTPQREVGFQAIAERVGRFPEVKTLYLMSGAFDLAVLVEGKTMQEVAFFVATKLAPLEGVTSTTSHFVLQTFKEEGVIVEDGEGDHRLVVSP